MATYKADIIAYMSNGMLSTNDAGATPPCIQNIAPQSGSASGGTTVTLSGSFQVASGNTVTVGGNNATVVSESLTSISITTPAGTAGAADIVLTNANGSSTYSGSTANGWTYTSDTLPAVLDRQGVCDAIAQLLKGDTSTLYGTGKLVSIIDSDPTKYYQARVDRSRPFAIYLWAEQNDTGEGRMQNVDDAYSVDLRYVGSGMQVNNIMAQLDNAHETVKNIVRSEMWDGNYLSGYHTDSDATVLDIVVSSSTLSAPEETETGELIFNVEGAITILVNKLKA